MSTRPAGLSSGFGYLLFGWMAAYGLLRLTGATTVAILLAAAVVHAVAAIVGGWIRLRRHGAIEITAPTTVDVGKPFPLVVCARRGDLPPIHCRVIDRGADVAAGWLQGSNTELEAVFVELVGLGCSFSDRWAVGLKIFELIDQGRRRNIKFLVARSVRWLPCFGVVRPFQRKVRRVHCSNGDVEIDRWPPWGCRRFACE